MVPEHHAHQMTRYLPLRSAGNANTMIKAFTERNEHPLETWRFLSWEHDPKGLGSEMVELSDLVSPIKLRGKSLPEISTAIESWEAMERRHKQRQGIELPEKVLISVLISVLFKLIPEQLAEEILKQTTKWTSYSALKDFLHTLKHLRTTGSAPMLYNLEGQGDEPALTDEEIVTEDGEVLRFERRNDKPVAVRTPPVTRGNPPSRTPEREAECHVCGKKGHFRRNCRSTRHKDGRPLRPPPPPRKGAGNLEEEGDASQDAAAAVAVGTLEIELNALNSIGSDTLSSLDEVQAWNDWMQDADLDPWSCTPCAKPTTFQLPTLKDLYGWKDVCAHCDKAGVHVTSISRQRPHQDVLPVQPLSPALANVFPFKQYSLTAPTPQTPPRSIVLASCVSDLPEDEVIERLPAGPMSNDVPTLPHIKVTPPPVHNVATQETRVAWKGLANGMDFTCPVCLGPGKFLQDPCPLCDGMIRPSICTEMEAIDETEVIELNHFEMTAEDKLQYDQVDITMDSDAGAPAADPQAFPGCQVTDPPGSLAGQMFVTPDGTKIATTGQFVAKVRLDDGRVTKSTYQAVAVRKPLMAVSSVSGKGNLVIFDEKGSFVLPGIIKDLISRLRALVQQAPDKVKLHRKKGIFHMRAWKLKPGFTRQGR